MRSRTPCLLPLLSLVLIAVPALAQPRAGDCVIGPGLGSTLLFPYFETDLNNVNGAATLVSINNGLAGDTLARVVLWTDWGTPTLAFDLYLPAFAVSTFNLRDTFNGGIPSTGEGVDLSQFAFCDTLPPFHSNPALSADQVAQLRADHTGQEGPLSSSCAGAVHNDGFATGYITVDVVDECSGVEGFNPVFTPANVDYPYFDDGASTGIAINDNRLWGDIFYLSNDESSAHGSGAISLWADSTLFAGSDLFTFYGRLSGWDGRDNRVPLPYQWDQRFINGGPFAGGADLLIYQDTGQGPVFVDCGFQPAGFPLAGNLTAVNETADDFIDLTSEFDQVGGLATRRGQVSHLSIPYPFGWIQVTTPGAQSWVQPTLSASGVYSASLDGTPVGFLCDSAPTVAPPEANRSNARRGATLSKAAQTKLRMRAAGSQ